MLTVLFTEDCLPSHSDTPTLHRTTEHFTPALTFCRKLLQMLPLSSLCGVLYRNLIGILLILLILSGLFILELGDLLVYAGDYNMNTFLVQFRDPL